MPASFGQPTVASIVKQLESGVELQQVNVTNNATMQMRPAESMAMLKAALKQNDSVKVLVLRHCGLNDAAAAEIGALLAENQTLQELDLENNNISAAGAIAIANGLRANVGLRQLNMLNQQGAGAFGEACLEKYQEMLGTNVTLTKILWRLQSRKSFALTKLITRNVEIWRRIAAGRGDYVDILPDHMRESPPRVLTDRCPPQSCIGAAPTPEAQKCGTGAAKSEVTVAEQPDSQPAVIHEKGTEADGPRQVAQMGLFEEVQRMPSPNKCTGTMPCIAPTPDAIAVKLQDDQAATLDAVVALAAAHVEPCKATNDATLQLVAVEA
jgi:hypothetical protein